MAAVSDTRATASPLEQFAEALYSGTFMQLSRMLNGLPGPDIADSLEYSPPKNPAILWRLLDMPRELQELACDVQPDLLQALHTQELVRTIEGMEPDDIADILQQLPDQVIREALTAMDIQNRLRVEQILPCDEDTAGDLIYTDAVTVRPDLTLDVVLRYLRRHQQTPEITDSLYVVNRSDQLLGQLALGQIQKNNVAWLLNRELAVAALNGALWSLVAAGLAIGWYQDSRPGMVIGTAMMSNLLVGAAAWALLPVSLKNSTSTPPALAA